MAIVKVHAAPVLTEWRHREGRDVEFCVESSADVDLLVHVFAPVVEKINADLGYDGVVVGPAPFPRGVMFFVTDCDDPKLVRGMVEQVGQAALTHDIDARVGLVRSEYSPLSSHTPPGFIAGLSIRSAGHEAEPGSAFVADPAAVDAIAEYGLLWCNVPNGRSWLRSGLSVFKVDAQHRSPLFRTAARSEEPSELVSAEATKLTKAQRGILPGLYRVHMARTVNFGDNSHVIFGIASEDALDWESCVDDLRRVVVDLREFIDYALIQASPVSPMLWSQLHTDCWPHRNDIPYAVVEQTRDAEDRTVAGGYGIQLLGPHHQPRPAGPEWSAEEYGDGKALVSHTDPDRWFAKPLTADLLLGARESFANLLWDRSWRPDIS